MRLAAAICLAPLLLSSSPAPPAAAEPRSHRPGFHHSDGACDALGRALDFLEALAEPPEHPGWRDGGGPRAARDRGQLDAGLRDDGWGSFWRRFFLRAWARRAARRLAAHYASRCVALNQVQVLGTHNSYHIEPLPELIDVYVMFDPGVVEWEYTHRPLGEQFEELGVRQIELDVFADPDGGLYADPLALGLVAEDPHIPELEPPGMKVLHVQDLDWDTTCYTLTDCLARVKAWSDANPDHLPLMVLVEVKDEPLPDLGFEFVVPLPFGADEFDDLDAEIRAVFPEWQLITPDDVRGRAPTLEDAVLSRGWPSLREARGRVLFALDNGGSKRDIYRQGRPSLEGRVLFTNAVPGDPDAAFVKLNDPIGSEDLIRDLVRAGYIVRTRADAGTVEARFGFVTRRESALASGAQYVSSDYPEPDPRFTDYFVAIPGGDPGRCNPVIAPPGCRSFALER